MIFCGGAGRRWRTSVKDVTPSGFHALARAASGQLVADPTIRAGNFQSKPQRCAQFSIKTPTLRFPPERARSMVVGAKYNREQRGLWVQLGQLGR
jgi:hypothetical protein